MTLPKTRLRFCRMAEGTKKLINEKDEQVLEHLIEVKLERWQPAAFHEFEANEASKRLREKLEQEGVDFKAAVPDEGFQISFIFAPNAYLDHSVIPKLKCYNTGEVAETEMPEWINGYNPTLRARRKKVKRKGKPAEIVTETKPRDSFFRIFQMPSPEDEDEAAEHLIAPISQLHEQVILPLAEHVITNAAGYYLQTLTQEDFPSLEETAARYKKETGKDPFVEKEEGDELGNGETELR